MKNNIITDLKRGCKLVAINIKKNAPQIMVVLGAAGTIGAGVLACKETLELEKTLDECHEEINYIEEMYATHEDYTEHEYKKALTVQTAKNAVSVAKLYAPSVGLGVASIALIFGSNNMMKKRNASLAAAYATVDAMWKKYRRNVIESFGEEIDHDMRFGIKHEMVEETYIDEKGKEHKTQKTIDIVEDDPSLISDYSRFFDASCKAWDENPEYNLLFLKGVQSYCNNLLQANGYLFLNDVYKQLGFEPSIAGQSVGWIYDPENPIGDNYVDFGIYEISRRKTRDFVNGLENVVLLDFNVDGDILNSPLLKLWRH